MEFTKVQIHFFKKGSFHGVSNENEQHIKVLPYLSVVQSVSGSYGIALGQDLPQQTGDGGFFIAPAGIQQTIVHHVNKESGKMSARWVFLDAEINGAYKPEDLYVFPVVAEERLREEWNAIFDRLFETDDLFENYSDLYKLLGSLLQNAKPTERGAHKGILSAVTYMKEHYPEPISIEQLARIAKMSESNFYAVFKKHMGDSPISYMNHYRLSIAADRLTETDQTVNEISYAVGFNDPLYFRKLFKKTYGMTPKEYRCVYRRKP